MQRLEIILKFQYEQTSSLARFASKDKTQLEMLKKHAMEEFAKQKTFVAPLVDFSSFSAELKKRLDESTAALDEKTKHCVELQGQLRELETRMAAVGIAPSINVTAHSENFASIFNARRTLSNGYFQKIFDAGDRLDVTEASSVQFADSLFTAPSASLNNAQSNVQDFPGSQGLNYSRTSAVSFMSQSSAQVRVFIESNPI